MAHEPGARGLYAVWEVAAGRDPDVPDATLQRTFRVTVEDWNDGDEPGRRLFSSYAKEASDYAVRLMREGSARWVRLDFRIAHPPDA